MGNIHLITQVPFPERDVVAIVPIWNCYSWQIKHIPSFTAEDVVRTVICCNRKESPLGEKQRGTQTEMNKEWRQAFCISELHIYAFLYVISTLWFSQGSWFLLLSAHFSLSTYLRSKLSVSSLPCFGCQVTVRRPAWVKAMWRLWLIFSYREDVLCEISLVWGEGWGFSPLKYKLMTLVRWTWSIKMHLLTWCLSKYLCSRKKRTTS